MTKQRYYTAFGLTLASDFAFEVLEEIAPPASGVDLTVLRSRGLVRTDHDMDPLFDIAPDRQYLHWRSVGAFLIEDPSIVRIEPHDGVSDHLVSQAFLGLVFSLLLERRGTLSLHAGAVDVDGRALVFLGDKGAGKSTTTGALVARGHALVTDDLVAVTGADQSGAPLLVQPGFASMKLWPDSVSALGLPEHSEDRFVHPSSSKRQKRVTTPTARSPVPMGALFQLYRSPEIAAPAVRRLVPHMALEVVMCFTFMARYGETRLGREHLALHMKRCGGIVARVPVYELEIPDDITRLSDLVEVVQNVAAGV